MLRNTHLRAYHDIRILMMKLTDQWQIRDPKVDSQETLRTILATSLAERERIARYIRDAETALKSEASPTRT